MSRPAVSKSFLKSIGVQFDSIKKLKKSNKNRWRRAVLLQRDPYCYYCGCELTLDDSTLDHALPLSKGGTTEWYNLVLSCWQCNQDKADKVVINWAAIQ